MDTESINVSKRELQAASSMGEIDYKKLKGRGNFRVRLLLATLSATPILVACGASHRLLDHEVSLLRLIEKVSKNCFVEIDDTRTKFKYKPGIVMGGRDLVHDCGVSRSIGYFMEPLIILGLFSKNSLRIRLKGITNGQKDPSVDTFCSTTLLMLKRFGVPKEGLYLKIESRGSPPLGGGEVILSIPAVQNLTAVNWFSKGGGIVKSVRGITYSTHVSSEFQNIMIDAACEILNQKYLDVHIFTDHRAEPQTGNSPGYGISLVAECSSGFFSADAATYDVEKKEMMLPEKVGKKTAQALSRNINKGGVVNSTHQCLLFLLCALCPRDDVSQIRVGELSLSAIETLKEIAYFLKITFIVEEVTDEGRVLTMLKCRGWRKTEAGVPQD